MLTLQERRRIGFGRDDLADGSLSKGAEVVDVIAEHSTEVRGGSEERNFAEELRTVAKALPVCVVVREAPDEENCTVPLGDFGRANGNLC